MSSAGQIVGGIVGGIVGFFVGGPAGAVKGIYIGSTIGGVIDPPKGPTIRGPRLDDLSVQTATYGSFIPRVYGTVAIHGNVFWVQGDKLIEEKKVTDSGGKGGPTQTTETFEYFATFAVGLCEGPIAGVRRIWIGGQLWYDAGTNDVNSIVASNQKSSVFELYTGTELQTADPLMQADKGAANVPAYRGLAYIVFERLPLANYSNSLMGAQVKVEVVKDGALSGSLVDTWTIPTNTGWHTTLAASGNPQDNEGFSNFIVSAENYPWEPYWVRRVGGTTLVSMLYYGEGFVDSIPNALNDLHYAFTRDSGRMVYFGSGGGWSYYDPGIGNTVVSIADGNGFVYVIKKQTSDGTSSLISVPYGNTSAGVSRYSAISLLSPTRDHLVCTWNGDAIVVSDLTLSPNTVLIEQYREDASGNLYLVDNYSVYLPNTGDLLSHSVAVHGNDLTIVYDVSTTSAGFVSIDLRKKTLNFERVIAGTISPAVTNPTAAGIRVFNNTVHYNQRIVQPGYSFLNAIWFIDKIANGTTPLSSVVSAECLKSKLITASDIDVTELTDTVRGYRIPALGAIRAGLDPLRAAWPFDVVQSGYKIKFKKRGGASVATITAGELDAHAAGDSPGVSITDSREMDLVLPYKVGVKYLDTTREYDTNEQYDERLNTDAVNETAIDLPIVFTANEAAGKAETLLYMYWLERYDVTLKLPPSYAHLEPGDVITVQATHATYSLRLTSVNHTPEGRLECQAKYNSASIYTPAAQGSEGASVGVGLTLAGPSAYQLLDIPMLRDADNVPGFPVAMTGYLAGWPGGVLFRSEDAGETWLDIAGFRSPGTVMGYATNALGAHGGTVYDFASTMTVRLYQGTLSSVTEAQLFAAQNWFAYGKDGRWEIIAARTATLQADGSYILRDFLRGQLGTEWATGQHAVNDSIVRLNAANLEFVNVNSNTIGSERNYRGITAGKALDSDSNRAFTYRGVNLECLSPVHATGDRDPVTNDWNITWVRRSRFAGWRDLVDASLGETAESYEVDIFSDNTYTTLKRTLTSVTPNVIYTSANQVTDFGANQPTIYLKIYQLSSVVGRGYPLTISLTR